MMLTLVPATIAGRLVDEVLNGRQYGRLGFLLAAMILVPLSRSLITLLLRYLFESSSQDSTQRVREALYRHHQELDATYYNRSRTGDIMAKMTGDVDMVRHFVGYTSFVIFESVVLFIGGSIYMIVAVNWLLALIALAISPALFVLTYRLGKAVRPIWSQIREAYSRLNSVVQQNIAGNRVVRAFARAEFEEKKFERENQAYRDANQLHNRTFVRFWPVLDAIANFLIVPVLLVGGLMVIRGRLTLGGLVTFNGLLFVIAGPMRNAGNLMNEVQRFSASAVKLIDVLIERPRIVGQPPQTPQGRERADVRGKVEFRDVTFSYVERAGSADLVSGARRICLDRINLIAEPGSTVGIIGLTGAGKTSLINLIPRLYDPQSGTVLIDDLDVRQYNLQELRRSIGMVMQDVFLFSDTIEGNIAFGDPEMPMEQVVQAARIASADAFARATPDGYDTIIGERGVGLSGGQRQRSALARALAIQPRILILDDTTSAVDMETEQEIQTALREHLADTTVFIIAHRISSVRRADEIIVMDEGRIIERGNHDQLMALHGAYFDVFALQAGLTPAETEALAFRSGPSGEKPLDDGTRGMDHGA